MMTMFVSNSPFRPLLIGLLMDTLSASRPGSEGPATPSHGSETGLLAASCLLDHT